MANNKLTYQIDFKVNTNTLKTLSTSLDEIISISNRFNLNDELLKSSNTARTLSSILDSSFNKDLGTINISRFRDSLIQSGMTLKTISTDLSKFGNTGVAAFSALRSSILGQNVQLEKSNKLLDDMALSMKNTVKWGVTSSIFNSMSGSIQQAWGYAQNLDKSLNNIRIVTGQSSEQMAEFAKNANTAAKALGASTTSYTDAALIYYQQGLGDQEVAARAETTVKVANVTGQTGDQVSEQLTAVWNGYKVSAAESELYIDKLAAVAAATAADLEELSTGMGKVASAANLMGVDIDQLNATLATVVSVTREAPESIGTAFKTIYARMGDIEAGLDTETTLGNYTEEMAAMGFNVLDANGNLRDMGAVIEEIGSQWNYLTREQQIALSQTVAGTRQYNNLLSLFDNWDMYTDALNTSANAAGTLQEQQDIYMDSLAAKLQTLTTTTEGLYDSLFNEEEIKTFIELITNAVDSVGGLTEAFGGGSKALASFGALAATVFQKQIGQGLGDLAVNKDIRRVNQENFKLQAEALSLGPTQLDSNANAKDTGAWAYDNSLYENGLRTFKIEQNLTNEKRKQFKEQQLLIAELEKETAILTRQMEIEGQKLGISKENVKNIVSDDAARGLFEDDLNSDYLQLENNLSRTNAVKDAAQGILSQSSPKDADIARIKLSTELNAKIEELSGTERAINQVYVERLSSLEALIELGIDEQKNTDKLLNLLDDIEENELEAFEQKKQQYDYTQKINKETEKTDKLKKDISKNKTDLEDQIRQEEIVQKTTQKVQALTSAVGLLTSAWGGVSSLTSIWNSEDLELGDKIAQTITTIAMLAPAVISAYNGMGSAILSYTNAKTASTIADKAAATAQMTDIALDNADIASTTGAASAEMVDTTATNANTIATTANANADIVETGADLADTISTSANTAAEVANTNAKITNAGATASKVVATGSEVVATNAATVATWAFNAALLANPIFWVVAGIVGLVAAGAALVANLEAQAKAQRDANLAVIEAENAKQAEIQANLDLMNSYLDIAEAYEEGTASKDAMASSAENLVDILGSEAIRVAELTGNYNNLTAAIKEARLEELEKQKTSLKTEAGAAGNNLIASSTDSDGGGRNNGEYVINFNQGLAASDGDNIAARILEDTVTGFTTNGNKVLLEDSDPETILRTYTELNQALEEMREAGASNSELYKDVQGYVNDISEDALNFKNAIDEINNIELSEKIIEIDFDTIQTKENFDQKRQEIIDLLKTQTQYNGLTEQELLDIANSAITTEGGDNANTFLDSEALGNSLYNLSDSNTYSLNGTSEEDLRTNRDREAEQEELFNQAKRERENAQSGYDYALADYFLDGALSSQDNQTIENYENLEESARLDKELYDAQLTQIEEIRKAKEDALAGLTEPVSEDGELVDGALNSDQVRNLAGIESEQLNSLINQELDGQTFENSADYANAYAEAIVKIAESSKFAEDALINLTEADIEFLDSLGVTEDAYERYVKQLVEGNDELDLNSEFTKELAKQQIRAEKGLQDLVDNFEDWIDLLENGDKDSIAYMETMSELGAALENTFGREISTDFIENNLEDIGKMADGDVEAMRRLDEALAEDFVLNMDIKGASSEEIAEVQNELLDFINYFDGKDISIATTLEEVEGIDAYVNSLNEMLKYSQITEEQANGILSEIGFDPEFTTQMGPELETHINTYDDQNNLISTTRQVSTTEVPMISAKGTTFKGSIPKSIPKATSSSSSGGSGSVSEPAKEDNLESEADVYHDVDIALKQISNSMETIQEKAEELFGGEELIENYIEQYKLLNQEISTTAEKIKIAESEQQRLQKELSSNGVTFNADGTMANYFEAYEKQLASVNGVINYYNTLTADGQEAYQDTLDAANEEFDKFVEAMQEYDDTVTDLIPSLEASIEEMLNEQIELQIDSFNMEIDLRLDLTDAKNEWHEFRRDLSIDENDIIGNADSLLKQLQDVYYRADGQGIIQGSTKDLEERLKEVDEAFNNGEGIYGDHYKTAMEDLQNYYVELMGHLGDFKDQTIEIQDAYIDMMNEAQEKFEEQISTYETIRDLLQHDMDIISMIYGEDSYSTLAKFYEQQEENNNAQLDFQRMQIQLWKDQMDSAEEGSEAWYTAKENWLDAVSEWNAAVEESITNLQDKYLNTINLIFQELNDNITGGLGLEHTSEEWDLINQNADRYLDSVNSIYETQKIANKYQSAIDETTSLSAQKTLNELMNEEIKLLQEKDQLSQYDIDRADLRYQIALKQIALEEAQQNKSTMRLKRDSQGNYNYQYVADEDRVSALEGEMSDLYNQLYNLDADQYKENLDEIYDVWEEFQSKMVEAAQINDPEERAERELLLQEQYGEMINNIVSDNEFIKENLYDSTMSHLFDLYDQNHTNYDQMTASQKEILDQFLTEEMDLQNMAFDNLFDLYNKNLEGFKNMTEEQKDLLMNSMLPQWNSGVQSMIDKIAGEGGFEEITKEAFEQIKDATISYEESLKALQEESGQSFDDMASGLNGIITETEGLVKENQDLISTYEQELAEMDKILDALDEMIEKYEDAAEAAEKATEEAYNYWAEVNKEAIAQAEADAAKELADAASKEDELQTGSSSESSSSSQPSTPSLNSGSFVDVKDGVRWYETSYGKGSSGVAHDGIIKYTNSNGTHPYNIDGLGWIKKSDIVGFDTGGYTGDWDSSGKVAMLHQKELVLNATDTENMLNIVSIVRDITNSLAGSLNSKMFNIGSIGSGFQYEKDTLEQTVQITAEFPNVKDSNEIEEALNNLVNKAAQEIYK